MTGTQTLEVVAEFAALPEGAIIYEQALAAMFHRHPMSIRRAVARGELPPPFRMMGRRAWTAGALVQHLQARQKEAVRKQAALDERVARLAP